ncbi:hypothetical protein J2755_000457 [Methanohalophilus levihalophilus]|uniref:PEF-CTERM sorting domain-containing protein n=1 Tax=Methanohalophilus levihalophilus TaxID=1431282 RepID=UPI001FD9B152|nr:PEF-CTERM sorting domain-containing protein [Methanohalophilus levihalophilus]MBP2029537.1 hypothetical protein [Methanohalophilus levihalophilus]
MKLKYLTGTLVAMLLIGLIGAGTAIAPAVDYYDFQKTDGLEEICAGETFTYDITYNITDPSVLRPLSLTTAAPTMQYMGYIFIDDILPSNVSFVSATDDGVYNASTHSVEWDLEYPESTKTLTVTVTESSASTGYVLFNAAYAEFEPEVRTIATIDTVSSEPQYRKAGDKTLVIDCQKEEIPEFPTVALPIAAILGLAFIFQRRKNE